MSRGRYRFRPRVLPQPDRGPLARLLPRLSSARAPALLDSAGGEPARFSILGFDPLPADPSAAPLGGAPAAFAWLRALHASLEPAGGDPVPGPFAGGFLGALAYDLGVAGEGLTLPAEPWGLPLVAGGLYVDYLVRDEARSRTWLVLGEEPGDGRPSIGARRRGIEELLAAEPPGPAGPRPLGPLARCVPPAEHRRRVQAARELIAAGEIYQANLAHRLLRPVAGDPRALYLRLRRENRAPYMGYLDLGEAGALLSASPELLLEVDAGPRGLRARTRPIKGTAPRSPDPAEDRERARALLASPKDLAELGMIVDLERNDLGRVARAGSVRVEGFPSLRSYARVHHLVADVVAEPRPGADALDVLAALFPGGSVTGAPKLRSMEVIAELEGEGRGFFCGSLGCLDTRGRALWSVLIRTLLWRPRPDLGPGGGEVSFRVGGGITWSSEPAAEDAETLAKAASLAAALELPAGAEAAAP